MTEFEESLLASGYRRYGGPGPWTNADRFWQKKVRAGEETLYFINVGVWEHRKYTGVDGHVGYEAEAHLSIPGHSSQPRLAVPIRPDDGEGVAWLEAAYSRAYRALGCVPDEHNN